MVTHYAPPPLGLPLETSTPTSEGDDWTPEGGVTWNQSFDVPKGYFLLIQKDGEKDITLSFTTCEHSALSSCTWPFIWPWKREKQGC